MNTFETLNLTIYKNMLHSRIFLNVGEKTKVFSFIILSADG